MMRIALIAGTYHPDRCGVAHYTHHLRQQLAQRGIESIVLTIRSAAAASSDPTVQGVIDRWHGTNLLPLVRAIHATQADLLHIQHAAGTYGFDRSIFLLPLLLKLTGWQAPIVTTIHEYGWWEWQPPGIPTQWIEHLKVWGQQRGWWDREDGFLLTQSHALITTNRDAEQVIHARLPHLHKRVQRIPIAANVEVEAIDRLQARATLRQKYGWSDTDPVIAFFGFLHPVKGLETLLPTFQHVLAMHPEAKLLLIGGVESLALKGRDADRYWHQLKDKIAELDLQNQVQMTGYLDNTAVSHHLSGVDIGVLPFNHGVTLKSGSLLAMMAHHLPIVATHATPPDPDIPADAVQIIPPRHSEALSDALTQLLSDMEQRDRLATNAYQFSQQFSWSSIAEAHVRLYRHSQ